MSARPSTADLPSMTLSRWVGRIRPSWQSDEGQTLAEYAVVLGVITPIVVLAFMQLSDAVIPAIDAVRDFL